MEGELAGWALRPRLPLQDLDPGFGTFTNLYSLYLKFVSVGHRGVAALKETMLPGQEQSGQR